MLPDMPSLELHLKVFEQVSQHLLVCLVELCHSG